MNWLVITALVVAAAPVSAEIYRCQNGESLSFSDRPCLTGSQQRVKVSAEGVEAVVSQSEPAAEDALDKPAIGSSRVQLEASIAAAVQRLELLRREREDVISSYEDTDSLDAQMLAIHYTTMIEPLEQELDAMKSRLSRM